MKKIILGIALLLMLVAAGVFFYFSGRVYEIRLSQDEILEKLSDKLPFSKRYLLIFEITLSNPRVTLTEGSDRVGIGLDAGLNIDFSGSPISLGGAVDVTSGVRYQSESGRFYLTDPVVDRVTIEGIPERFTNRVNGVLSTALAEYYETHPIYTLRPTDVKTAAARLILQDVTVEDGELVIKLGIN